MAVRKIYICDRCKKEDTLLNIFRRGKYIRHEETIGDDDWIVEITAFHHQLCNNCYAKLKRFLKGESLKGDKA